MDCPDHLVFNPHLQRCDLNAEEPLLCRSNPCLNNGKCVESVDFDFRCECAPGFSGQNCERIDACSANPCGPEGTCVSLSQGSPLAHLCICSGGRSIGQSCRATEMNPCMQQGANMKMFPLGLSRSVFAHCEGTKPHFKFCQHPLIFSPSKQSCDWF